jgi:phosphatidylethanolamine/phosphatidyl-N-methylethanolamine N-methyltransferase
MDAAHVERVYSSYANVYDLIFGRVFHRSRCDAVELLGLKPDAQVLEIGVGTGLSLPLYPSECRVTGIDLSPKMLEKSRERITRRRLRNARVVRMDASRTAFADDAFDAVLAAYVMSVVPDPQATLREIERVCKPGGTIVMLNHFHATHYVGALVERGISPMCRQIGFRSDLGLEDLLAGSALRVLVQRTIGPFGYWTLVQAINDKPRRRQRAVGAATGRIARPVAS